MTNQIKRELLVFCSCIVPAFCLCYCCTHKSPQKSAARDSTALPYDLQNPSRTIKLASEELKEISGFGATDTPGVFLAIADERGEVFFVDGINDGAIRSRFLFRDKGDFEGVEMVGNTIWTVKSDGKLFEIANWNSPNPTVTEHNNPLKKSDDIEGLAYDAEKNVLLLASKGDPDSSYARKVYAFDPINHTLNITPVFSVDPKEVNTLVEYGDSEKHDYFSPSGIAVHPKTGDVYLISTALKRLVVLDKKSGKITDAVGLDKKIMPQPEGISFDKEGNLYLTSEGKGDAGLILKFDLQKK
jgi:uncharacterized protein YjiK